MQPVITHWDKERIHARDEVRQFEREQALEQIILLIRQHEVSFDELKLLQNRNMTSAIDHSDASNILMDDHRT